MRLPFLLRLCLLLLSLGLAVRPACAQTEAELTALTAQFPAARYGQLQPQTTTRSAAAEYRTWRIMAAGRWRWPATVRTRVAADGHLLGLLPDGIRPLPAAGLPAAPLVEAARGARLATAYLRATLPPAAQAGAVVRQTEPVWYVADSASGTERSGWLLTWGHPDSRVGAWEVLLDDATGQPVRTPRDLQCYHSGGDQLRSSLMARHSPRSLDTTALAYVFRPDPLTTARQAYGRPYVDSLDTDRPALNRQRVLDTLWLTFERDSFRLRNPWFRIAEFDPPAQHVTAARTAAGLRFTRAAAGFEQVNAFYHLTRARQYLGQLGYGALHTAPMRVDASGLSGADQSRFSPVDTTLSYGEGGVDDAEDADVVVHEYGHALFNAAAPGSNVGLERRTLDEANADYWAAAYSERLGGPLAYGREQVFNWDGHNEYWAGRWVISPKKYPLDLVGNPYLDADVWSATLWQIRAAVGAPVADRLFWEHLYGYAPNLTMPQAAHLLLQADTLLYGGAHAGQIYRLFDDRHILGTHVVVGTGAEGVLPGGARVWATDAFARGEAAQVRVPTGAHLALLSLTGARVWEGTATPNQLTEVPAAALPRGVYVLRLLTPTTATAVRLVRE